MGNQFTKKDFYFSVVTGFYAGFIGWQVLAFLGRPSFAGFSFAWLMLLIPILWILGVNLGYFLGQWVGFFRQFGRYAVVGFTNFSVDTGIVNLLIGLSGIASGWWFPAFKGISFLVAVTHSYFWNRRWVFESRVEGQKEEFGKFMGVNLVAIAINVGTASLVVNGINPMFGFDANTWANVGVIVGSATALLFNFIGFRLFVFKK
jgi:putative flippase GtrA